MPEFPTDRAAELTGMLPGLRRYALHLTRFKDSADELVARTVLAACDAVVTERY